MLDERMRQLKESAFDPLARPLLSVPPLALSIAGLALGVGAAVALWQGAYPAGFALWFLNRERVPLSFISLLLIRVSASALERRSLGDLRVWSIHC